MNLRDGVMLYRFEVCVEMRITGIGWVPWDSHENHNENVDWNGTGMGMGECD